MQESQALCEGNSLAAESEDQSAVEVPGLLTVALLLLRSTEPRAQTQQLLHSTWALPESGVEPASPALAGRFTTEPPGKSNDNSLESNFTDAWKRREFFLLDSLRITKENNS